MELQLAALRRAGIPHALLERSSGEVTRGEAARALLRGGRDEDDVYAAARELGADVVHVHNMLPLFGPRSLAAARDAGARVILQLHNLRLFCAIGVAARDGGPCFRCHHRFTLPGLALNCRGSLPEAAVYAAALARHQPAVLRVVDSFVVPSRYAAGQVAELGLPAERVELVPHYLPESAFAHHSPRRRGPARARRGPALAGEGDRHRDRGVRLGGGAAADRRRGAGSRPSSRRSPRGSGRRSSSSAGSTARRWGASSPARRCSCCRRATTSSRATRRSRRWPPGCRWSSPRSARRPSSPGRSAACRRTTRRRSRRGWRSSGTARTFAAARATPLLARANEGHGERAYLRSLALGLRANRLFGRMQIPLFASSLAPYRDRIVARLAEVAASGATSSARSSRPSRGSSPTTSAWRTWSASATARTP